MGSSNLNRNLVILLLYILFGVWFLVFVHTIINSFISKKITYYEYFIQYGDSASAFFTAITFFLLLIQVMESFKHQEKALQEADKDRKLLIEENQKNRRLENLSKRMEFYSELIGNLDNLYEMELDKLSYKYKQFDKVIKEKNVKSKYNLWGSDELISLFDLYFKEFVSLDTSIDYYRNKDELKPKINVSRYLDLIIETSWNDYEKLSKEYKELVKSPLISS